MNFLFLTIAGIVNACGVTLILQAAGLYDGGFSGTAILLANETPLQLSVYLLILNFPLFIFGYKKLGLNFIIYSLYAIAVYSLFAFLFENCFGLNFENGSPITKDDMLLSAIFGGIISGIGSGITIRAGGAIDGVEVLAVIFAKKIGMTVGTFVMSFNLILYIIAGIITKTWTAPLYSIIAYAVGLKAVDFIIEGFDKSKSAFIISNHPEQIADVIVDIFERGVTIINAEGYYSKKPKKLIYCVVNRFEINKLKKIVTEIDAHAFVSINDVSDSMGSSLKFKRRKKKSAPVVTEKDAAALPADMVSQIENLNGITGENSEPVVISKESQELDNEIKDLQLESVNKDFSSEADAPSEVDAKQNNAPQQEDAQVAADIDDAQENDGKK